MKTENKKDAGNDGNNRNARTSANASDSASASGGTSGSVGSGKINGTGAKSGNENRTDTSDSGSGAINSTSGDNRNDKGTGTSAGSGGSSNAGSGGSDVAGTSESGSEKRKRGRPKGSKNKDNSSPDSVRVNAPKSISTEFLISSKKRGKRDYSKPFAKSFKFLFDLPRYAGYGDHWPIDDNEANELGTKFNACVDSFPKGTSEKLAMLFEKYIDKYMPIVAFGTVAYVITEPRIARTKQLIADARNQNPAATESATTHRNNGNSESMHSGNENASAKSGDTERFSTSSI